MISTSMIPTRTSTAKSVRAGLLALLMVSVSGAMGSVRAKGQAAPPEQQQAGDSSEQPQGPGEQLAHESREAAKKSWDAFRNDPEWKTFRAASEVNGPLVSKAESTFVNPTEFSKAR